MIFFASLFHCMGKGVRIPIIVIVDDREHTLGCSEQFLAVGIVSAVAIFVENQSLNYF